MTASWRLHAMAGAARRCRLAMVLAPILAVPPVLAQQAPWSAEPARPPTAQPKSQQAQPKAAPAPKSSAPKEDAAASRSAGGDGALRQRVEQLEEQLADMQVTIGTLESLGKTSGGASAPAGPTRIGGGGVDQARIDSLETQIRALTAQVEQLSEQLRQVGNQRRGEAPLAAPQPTREAALPGPRTDVPLARPAPDGFGTIAVKPPGADIERDPIGRMLEPDQRRTASAAPLPPPAAQAGTPKELYETAYGYLLQQDYGAAEAAFDEFLRRYPNDRLTADAQYWLGETLYVQRRFKPAGQAFLKVIEQHKSSAKVPNSILKLALSLEQLGQKDCALFTELDTRHPNAAADVKNRARTLKQRVGCP